MFPVWKFLLVNFVSVLLASSQVLTVPRNSLSTEMWSYDGAHHHRQAKTMNTTTGMAMIKDMIHNAIPFRPTSPPFPLNLKSLFKLNGTYMTWVPLGSILFSGSNQGHKPMIGG